MLNTIIHKPINHALLNQVFMKGQLWWHSYNYIFIIQWISIFIDYNRSLCQWWEDFPLKKIRFWNQESHVDELWVIASLNSEHPPSVQYCLSRVSGRGLAWHRVWQTVTCVTRAAKSRDLVTDASSPSGDHHMYVCHQVAINDQGHDDLCRIVILPLVMIKKRKII